MERYKYRPLLPARHSIRLIQIQPGLPGTEIHCRIIDYTIQDDRASGPYEALSYVWGMTLNPVKIFVADIASAVDSSAAEQCFEVTSNLHDALQELRDLMLPRIMWIDAVCINQDDLEERSSQVNFMAKIYSYANQVVIWLGPGDCTETKELFAAIEDAAEIARQPAEMPSQPNDAEQYRKSPHRHVYDRSDDGSEQGGFDDFLEMALENLLTRPWFSRVWVLQEAAAARSILVKCGFFELPGSIFTNGVRFLQDSIHRSKRARGLSASVLEIMDRYAPEVDRPFSTHLSDEFRKVHVRRMPSLGNLIERFYLHGVSDRRDTIFAVLNLCSPASRCSIKPDYTRPWSGVWADAIRQILGPGTIVTTSTHGEQACLTVFGYILGNIELDGDGTLSMGSIYPFGPLAWTAFWGLKSECTPESWCKSIREEDIVFFTVGASAPSIIRACGDHFDVIVIAVPSPLRITSDRQYGSERAIDWQELLSSLTYAPRRASLVWDWCAEYPSSCTHHPQLFDGVPATPGPHPDDIARMKDSAHIIATLLPSMKSPTRRTPTASQVSLNYMSQQFNNPKCPPQLQTKLQLLRMLVHSQVRRRFYVWFVRQFETLRQVLWILCHHTDTITTSKWMLDYHQSERRPYYNIFEVASIVGLEARPQRDGSVVSLHLTDAADTHNGKYFADFFGNNIKKRYRSGRKWLSTAQHDIRRYLVTTVIRHSSVTIADIQTSHQLLFSKPLIHLRYDLGMARGSIRSAINLRAFDLIFACRPGRLVLSWSDKEQILDEHVLIMSIRLFSEPLLSTQMAYSILSAIFNLVLDKPRMSLQERINHGRIMANLEEYRLVERIIRELRNGNLFFNNQSLVSFFISYHLQALMRYIESMEILEIAAATADDKVLPFLSTLLNLDPDRYHPLQDYRENMVAQFAASKELPLSSDSEHLMDSSEDLMDGSEVSMCSGEDALDSDEELLENDGECSLDGSEYSVFSSPDWLQKIQYYQYSLLFTEF